MDDRERRQTALRELLSSEKLSNQKEVVERMRELGFAVTQSSVSRDFQELGIIKANKIYTLPSGIRSANRSAPPIEPLIAHIEAVGSHLIVVRTGTGAANVLAHALDKDPSEGMAGTIAGDDTVFIATRDRASQLKIINRLQHV